MIVVALVAVAAGLASFALRDPAAARLDQEAARLAAVLEGARSQARAAGLAVRWEPTFDRAGQPQGYRFIGLPDTPEPAHAANWLSEGVTAEIVGGRAVVLGPEPLIPEQRIVLRLDSRQLTLSTDGLSPFAVAEAVVTP